MPGDLVSLFQVIHGPNFKEELESTDIEYKFYEISDNKGIIELKMKDIKRFNKLVPVKSIRSFEQTVIMNQLGTITRGIENGIIAREEIGANFLQTNLNITVTGKGVLIAIIDSGIDYLHEDFIYPDRTSKVLFLWDQTKDEKPPKGYKFGTEYTREDINKAIANNDTTLSKDEDGNGTMLSGICAGLGNIKKEYIGIAPDAELIVVKLKKINGNYNNAIVETAIQYAYEKAYELKTPLVVNISLGSNNLLGATQGTLPESPLFTRGLCLVSSVGNEGNTQTHTSGKINFVGEEQYIEIEIFEDEDLLEVNIWLNKPDKASVAIISPSGEESKFMKISNYNEVSGIFDLEATWYVIIYRYPTSYSGQQKATVILKNATKGIWKLRLRGEYITNGIYNAYLPNRVLINPGTKFRDSIPSQTVNYPSTYNDVISVGAYNIIDNSIWPPSSRGPTINGLLRPDIVAPGVNIISTYPGNDYATITGTAAAAAHVTGAVALYFQYTLADRYYTQKAFTTMVRTYLHGGAKRNQGISYPNESYGYGLLDIRGAFDQLK